MPHSSLFEKTALDAYGTRAFATIAEESGSSGGLAGTGVFQKLVAE
jgi:hypothetical protein